MSLSPPVIVDITDLSLTCDDSVWSFETERREDIAAHWQAFVARSPTNYNGRVLLQHRWSLDNGRYEATYLEADFASFLAWRDWNRPGPPMRNGYAMAALRASDGAFLLGRMASHTANPGRIYFPAGTPDPGDRLADGRIDLIGSARRELAEETGLTDADVTFEDRCVAVIDGFQAAFMVPVLIPMEADEARLLMLERIAALEEQELEDIVIIRSRADLDETTMPRPTLAFLDRYLSP